MSENQSEPTPLHQLESIAAGIFADHGVAFSTAKRAGGWTNATWLAGGLALRLSTRPGGDSIRREARLAALLPPEVGYPTPIETGVTAGLEWSLAPEIPGQCLGEAWSGLSWAERMQAVRQLWAKAQVVHSVRGPAAAILARRRAWFNSNDAAEAAASTLRLLQKGLFTPRQAAILGAALDCFWKALPAADCVLTHGDLTLDNAIWQAGQVVSILDFEYALIAPVEIDLNLLVKVAFRPADEMPFTSDADYLGQQQLRQAVAELALPVIAHPGGPDLLRGYAILLDQWLLEVWLAHPEGEGPVEQWEPYRRLLSLADGQGGYLAQLFQQMMD